MKNLNSGEFAVGELINKRGATLIATMNIGEDVLVLAKNGLGYIVARFDKDGKAMLCCENIRNYNKAMTIFGEEGYYV